MSGQWIILASIVVALIAWPPSERQLARQYRSWSWLCSANGIVTVRATKRGMPRGQSKVLRVSASQPISQVPKSMRYFVRQARKWKRPAGRLQTRARDRHAGENLRVLPEPVAGVFTLAGICQRRFSVTS